MPVNHPRNTAVDLVKAIAILSVVIIHNCTKGYQSPPLSFDWFSVLLLRSAVSAGVPLFLMCTGALFLDPGKSFSVRRLFTRNLPRLLAALFVWALAYKIFWMYATGRHSLSYWVQAVKELLTFQHESHLYYLHIALIVYLLLPILRSFTEHAGGKELAYLLGFWFVFGILYPTVKDFWPISLIQGIPRQWAVNMTYSALGYVLLGRAVQKYPLSRRWYLLALLSGFAVVFGGTVWMSLRAGELFTGFIEGMSVGVCLLACGIFGLCSLKPPKERRVTRKLSDSSFCIYLTHLFFVYLLPKVGITTFAPYLLSIPLVSVLDIALSFCVYLVIRKIPILREWVI